MRITGGKILRRVAGNPRKDRLLRRLYQGERGLSFQTDAENGAAGGSRDIDGKAGG